MSEDPLETIILQTINGAIATIPGYLEEIKENKKDKNTQSNNNVLNNTKRNNK